MKNRVLVGILFVFIFSNGAKKPRKEFEGIITYSTVVESKTEHVTTAALQSAYGDVMTLFYKNGNYKMTFNGNDIKAMYYLKEKNTQYEVRQGIDTLYVSPCGTEMRGLISSVLQKKAGKVLNRKCNLIINNIGDAKNHYWYDPDMYVNPEHFKNHIYGHVNVYFEKAQAFWIKYRFEAVFMDLSHTATKIEWAKVPDSVFVLPPFPEKSQY